MFKLDGNDFLFIVYSSSPNCQLFHMLTRLKCLKIVE